MLFLNEKPQWQRIRNSFVVAADEQVSLSDHRQAEKNIYIQMSLRFVILSMAQEHTKAKSASFDGFIQRAQWLELRYLFYKINLN